MIANQVGGAAFGIELERGQNRRQLRQQEKLQQLQIAGNKEMLEAQRLKELQMWKDTSYPAQMAMMKEAGLNPALMYGMGGGGGTTVGGGGSAVSGGTATGASGQGMAGAMMGIQMKAQTELLQAQKENIQADTANKQAGTTNLGVGTELKKVELQIANKTWDDQVDIIGNEAQKGFEEVNRLNRENRLGSESYETRLQTMKAELGTILLTQNLIKAQTKTEQGKPALQAAEINLMREQASATFRGINLAWSRLEQDMTNSGYQNRESENRKRIQDVAESEKVPVQLVEGLLKAGLIGAGLNSGGTKVTETYGPKGTTQRYEWYQD